MRIPGILGALVVPAAALLLLAGPARSAAWLENVSMVVEVDGKPSGTAHLFDSDDYQRMLLALDGRPVAAVLDLAAGSVSAVPADSIEIGPDGTAEMAEVPREYLSALDANDGSLAFQWDKSSVQIRPMPPLIGPTTLQRVYEVKPSYATAAQAYRPDPAAVAKLKSVTAATEFRVYFGTWCLLCKRVLPGLIRTLEAAQNPKLTLTWIGVDEDSTQPAAEIERDRVSKTPTILILRNGTEIGRVEEKVDGTIEAEVASILAPRG